jgi:hypothetical protein
VAAGRPSHPSRASSARKKEGSAPAGSRRCVGGWYGEGGEIAAVGERLMDLSHWGQSRDAEGRHRAAHPGLDPWVGAQVASPRCPILRPGSCSVSGPRPPGNAGTGSAARTTGQKTPPGTAGQDQERVPGPSPLGEWSTRCGVGRVDLYNSNVIMYSQEGGLSATGL